MAALNKKTKQHKQQVVNINKTRACFVVFSFSGAFFWELFRVEAREGALKEEGDALIASGDTGDALAANTAAKGDLAKLSP